MLVGQPVNQRQPRVAWYSLCLPAILASLALGSFAAEVNQESVNRHTPFQETTPPTETAQEKLEVFAKYPVIRSTVGSSVKFEITLYYEGEKAKAFDLSLTAPEGWRGTFTGGYPSTQISAFQVEPYKKNEMIYLTVEPTTEEARIPGEYDLMVSAGSGAMSSNTDLKIFVVEPPEQYELTLNTSMWKRDFKARPVQGSHISIQLTNIKSGTVNNISLNATMPEGWQATFTPGSLNSLQPGITEELDMVIVPPAGTPGGDYPVVVTATGDRAETMLNLRISVVTETVTGFVVLGVGASIIGGLMAWFIRAGRIPESNSEY